MKSIRKFVVLLGVLFVVSGCNASKVENVSNSSESTTSDIEEKDVAELLEEAGYETNVLLGITRKTKTLYFFYVYLENVEEGLTIKGTVSIDYEVEAIRFTDKRNDVDGLVFNYKKYGDNQDLIDDYLDALKEIGIKKDQMMEYFKEAAEENKPDDEWIRENTEVFSSEEPSEAKEVRKSEEKTVSSSSSDAGKTDNDTGDADVEAAIKKVDAKYDEMITKAQGYVDKPDTYTDMASLTFLADYTELMSEYAKLGETINTAGDLSDSDALTMYTNMLTKSAKLTELYTQLG